MPGSRWLATALALGLAGAAAAETPPAAEAELVPASLRPLLGRIETGRNDSSPVWAPGGALLAFERAEEARREIVIARADGTPVKTVYYQANADDGGLGALLPNLGLAVSYNSGLAWSPAADRFVFMSNAGEGNYDLYLGTLAGSGAPQRLTRDPHKDGQPDWSPAGGPVVYVSGRAGGAQLYLLDVARGASTRLSRGAQTYLYPRWSPDGRRIAAIYGANENHDIVVIDDPTGPQPAQRALTSWHYDDLSPAWSPDGKRIAFYTNHNADDDPKTWAIAVVDAAGGAPTEGEGLADRIVARNVVPDVSMGPAWLPDGKRIAYVGNDQRDYNPIYVVDVDTRRRQRLATGTDINHDLACSAQGVLAFRAQVEQWDQIFVARIAD